MSLGDYYEMRGLCMDDATDCLPKGSVDRMNELTEQFEALTDEERAELE